MSAMKHSDRFQSLGDSKHPPQVEGLITIACKHSISQTVERLKNSIAANGASLFLLVDHAAEAAKAGMNMPPTQLLIFGNPRGGTQLMIASPTIAIDLPLKILVAEDAHRKVSISYNSPEYLQQRHMLPHGLVQNIAILATLAREAAE